MSLLDNGNSNSPTVDNGTSNSPTADQNDRGIELLFIILPTICLIGLIGIASFVAWKNKRRIRQYFGSKGR